MKTLRFLWRPIFGLWMTLVAMGVTSFSRGASAGVHAVAKTKKKKASPPPKNDTKPSPKKEEKAAPAKPWKTKGNAPGARTQEPSKPRKEKNTLRGNIEERVGDELDNRPPRSEPRPRRSSSSSGSSGAAPAGDSGAPAPTAAPSTSTPRAAGARWFPGPSVVRPSRRKPRWTPVPPERRDADERAWKEADLERCSAARSVDACSGVESYLAAARRKEVRGGHEVEARRTLAETEARRAALRRDDAAWRAAGSEACGRTRARADCAGVERYRAMYPDGLHVTEATTLVTSGLPTGRAR